MKLVLHKTHIPEEEIKDPVFFLAGPVRGGGDWQKTVFDILKSEFNSFYMVNPCRYEEDHSLFKYRAAGKEDHYEKQTDWERYYLEIASRPGRGCIIFWLGCESKEKPRTDGHPYGRDTYGELGEWRGRLMSNPKLNVVIGAEENFPGLSVISRNYNLALKIDFPIYKSLEETVRQGIEKYRQSCV